jgi:hypothetical protein
VVKGETDCRKFHGILRSSFPINRNVIAPEKQAITLNRTAVKNKNLGENNLVYIRPRTRIVTSRKNESVLQRGARGEGRSRHRLEIILQLAGSSSKQARST